ncbi:MAG: hypothetical protein MJ221_00960 [Bacilli bacterium]|nr:hypothetical protein [Bacilli bacterium]
MRWKKLDKQSLTKTGICKICFNKIEDNSLHSIFYHNPTICYRCFKETKPRIIHFKVNGINASALYDYDEAIKKLLFQFKGCYDYELRSVFLEYFYFYIKIRYFNYVIVPAPSSEKANKERGFNHVVEMCKILGLKIMCCIKKTADIKQSDLTQKERANISKHLDISGGEKLRNKNVLLVDDVYTTGSTIKAMINLVKNYQPKKIKILVLSKTVFDQKLN